MTKQIFNHHFLYILICIITLSCRNNKTLFRPVPADESGIHFSNTITEAPDLNILTYEYIYNGGGAGIADFNNDSLPDIYFTGNLVSNKLYINKGNFKFEDITDKAGVSGNGRWCKGVSIVDINNDGKQDIYISVAVNADASLRKNLLYINKGNDDNGIPVFTESAADYHLDDSSHTQMAAFFDYDNDGDLDVYLLLNDLIDNIYPNEFRPIHKDGSWPNTDKLLRNDYDSTIGHAIFTDISHEAGILIEGYGLGVSIVDINEDGWKDIYVSNDYLSNNILYINNGNGTFTDKCNIYLKHTSKNAMGNDIADMNNDGLADIIELDMAPEDNYRQKMMMNEVSYQTFQNSAQYDFMQQYVRNTLQWNQGRRTLEQDTLGEPLFSETAFFSGIAQTDWSWAPLAMDVDNDGFRDIFISNGFPKDLSDLDFIAYRVDAYKTTPYQQMLEQVPVVQMANYAFKNNGDYTFTNQSAVWGFNTPTFSAGMAYADLDLDGDLDLVINNTNMAASVLENTARNTNEASHFLTIELQGPASNLNAMGAIIKIFYAGQQQVYEQSPYRGYMSSVSTAAHFGLGKISLLDSVVVCWPGNKKQTVKNIPADAILKIKYTDAIAYQPTHPSLAEGNWFTNTSQASGLTMRHSELDFIDFNIQKLLPHKFTQYGPAIAVADINGDGLDDVGVGGGSPNIAKAFIQQADGHFLKQNLIDSLPNFKYQDDAALCFFDADGDGDADLYIASGGSENGPGYSAYRDHFYLNNGTGHFMEDTKAIPANFNSKSSVKAADFDHDGDLDLFVGGRLLPGSYPQPINSMLYRNDSKNNTIKFTDITVSAAPELINVGLVTDALWTDANNDGWIDLVIAGEWMPISFFKNENGKLKKQNNSIQTEIGWWNSLNATDVDNDGDMDYVAGNFGLNSYIKPLPNMPVCVYGKDFDGNESFDAVFTSYMPAALTDKTKKEFVIAGRDEFIREMTTMKGRFPNYATYANATMSAIFSKEQMLNVLKLSATNFNTSWIENKGNFQFEMHALPAKLQWAPVYAICAEDYNSDGNIDLMLTGNENSMAPYLGRCDALNGMVLKGDGAGNFLPLTIAESGLFIPGNGKSLAQLMVGNTAALVAGQNAGSLKLYTSKTQTGTSYKFLADDEYAICYLKNGKQRRVEASYGSSFYSQSSRFIIWNDAIQKIEIVNRKKEKRLLQKQ